MPILDDTTENIISVWLGTTHQSLEKFNEYTKGLDIYGSNCPIQQDFNCKFIDTDWFVAFSTADQAIISVEALCKEIDCSKLTQKNIIKRCHELNIDAGNSLYYHCNCTFTETLAGKLYNDLRFIGSFIDA